MGGNLYNREAVFENREAIFRIGSSLENLVDICKIRGKLKKVVADL